VVESVKTQALGHYRDGLGRLGAAQLVTVSRASELLKKANAAISEELVRDYGGQKDAARQQYPDCWRTLEMVLEAARRGHQWLTFEGQAIRGVVPVHTGEWARAKAKGLTQLFRDIARGSAKEADFLPFAQLLSSAPVSLEERGGTVTLRLGDPGRPTMLRVEFDREYVSNLEDTVRKEVPMDLALQVTRAVLKEQGLPLDPGVQALLEWGPPDVEVDALLGSAGEPNGPYAKQALEALRAWGRQWNQGGPEGAGAVRGRGVPAAPSECEDQAQYLAAWKDWSREMHRFPMEPGKKAQGAQGARNDGPPPR